MCNIPDNQIRVLEKETIDCKDVKNLMCDYADGDLTSSLKERLDDHCQDCPPCEEFRDSYLKTIELAKELRDIPTPEDVQRRLREALNKRLGLSLGML